VSNEYPETNIRPPSTAPYEDQLVHLEQQPDLEASRRISLPNLTAIVGATLHFGREPNVKDYLLADADYINSGLYVARGTYEFDKAHHVVRLGVYGGRRDGAQPLGVVFPPYEFKVVARNARDLGRHTVNRTRDSRWSSPDRDESREASMRSAGHALMGKIESQRSLSASLDEERLVMRALFAHLMNPSKQRIRASRLKGHLALLDEKIHEDAEMASIIHQLKSFQVVGMHKAIRRNIYTGNLSSAQRSYNLARYILVVGRHSKKKIEKLKIAQAQCQEQLPEYQSYLDAKEA
jgi:hypothetical protein